MSARDISFNEFYERNLVGLLIYNPALVTDIARVIDGSDFGSIANGVIFEHIRDLVAEAQSQTSSGDIVWALHGDEPETTVLRVQRSEITGEQLRAEQALHGGRYVAAAMVEVPAGTPDEALADTVRRIMDNELPEGDVGDGDVGQVDGVDPSAIRDRIAASGDWPVPETLGPYMLTLMNTSPPLSIAQPEVYAEFVMEASIRRSAAEAGVRVGQVVEKDPDLHQMLTSIDAALDQISGGQQRWAALTASEFSRALDTSPGAAEHLAAPARYSDQGLLDFTRNAPSAQEARDAEEAMIGAVLANPRALPAIEGKVVPEDLLDDKLANTLRAAFMVLDASGRTGRRVDPVTVARQQEINRSEHGVGASPNRILELVNRGVGVDVGWVADVVMRGSLSRMTAEAARTVRKAALNPALELRDVLATGRTELGKIHSTTQRMATTGPRSLAQQGRSLPGRFGGLGTRTAQRDGREESPAHPAPQGRSLGDLERLGRTIGGTLDRISGSPEPAAGRHRLTSQPGHEATPDGRGHEIDH